MRTGGLDWWESVDPLKREGKEGEAEGRKVGVEREESKHPASKPPPLGQDQEGVEKRPSQSLHSVGIRLRLLSYYKPSIHSGAPREFLSSSLGSARQRFSPLPGFLSAGPSQFYRSPIQGGGVVPRVLFL